MELFSWFKKVRAIPPSSEDENINNNPMMWPIARVDQRLINKPVIKRSETPTQQVNITRTNDIDYKSV